MIKRKLKICKTCGDPSYIWAHGNCKRCDGLARAQEAQQQPKLTQTDNGREAKPFRIIKPVSDKQAKINKIYATMAPLFKTQNPYCMAKLPGCTGLTAHVHHLFSGASRSKYYLDTTTWIGVCDWCHHLIHDVMGKDELVELGLKRME